MIPHWPAALPPLPMPGQSRRGPKDDRLSFEPERGPPLTRRATTSMTGLFQGGFPPFTAAQLTLFEGWVEQSLDGGVLPFAWRGPDGLPRLWQIAPGQQLYDVSDLGADLHEVSLSLIQRPGAPWWAPYVRAGESRVPFVVADYALSVFGVAARKTAAAAVAAVAGTFDVYTTTGGVVTAELAHVVVAGDIPSTAPGGVTRILAYMPEA